jgi:hypothetical protein
MDAQLVVQFVPIRDAMSRDRSYTCCISPLLSLELHMLIKILSRGQGFGLVIGSVGLLKPVTARIYKGFTDLQFTMARMKTSECGMSSLVVTW